jgi:hypothetical protein
MKLFVFLFLFSFSTLAQKSIYSSNVDADVSIRKITILPMVDNLKGIYSNPLNEHLLSIVDADKQWQFTSFPNQYLAQPEVFEDSPDKVKQVLNSTGAQALLTSRLSKGPNGISIKFNFYLGKEGKLFIQQRLTDYTGFETSDLKNKVTELYKDIKKRLPYDGVVLSRKGLLVTVNLGINQGLSPNAELSVIQIIKINRHPKFHFLVSSEKEIIGKIKIQKVDDNLSFGTITSEREEGVIQTGFKFNVDTMVDYPEAPLTAEGKIIDELAQKKDGPIAYGNQAREWVPDSDPTYGRVGVLIGLGTYSIGNNLSSAGGVSATNSLIPSIQGTGEIWINPEWLINFNLRQFVFSVTNPYTKSTPGRLNISTSQYTMHAGYNFLLEEKFFGPKIQLSAGYSSLSSYVDQSTPVAFTSMTYSGLVLGVGGSFPLSLESRLPISLGAKLNLFFNPSLSESPVTSGNPSNNITSFNAFGEYRYSNRINVRFVLDYDLFSSNFSGSGTRTESATSASHTMTTVSTGIEYLF